MKRITLTIDINDILLDEESSCELADKFLDSISDILSFNDPKFEEYVNMDFHVDHIKDPIATRLFESGRNRALKRSQLIQSHRLEVIGNGKA